MPMRVTVVSQFYLPEPAVLPANLAQHLAAAGHSVDVVTGVPNYPDGKVYPGFRLRAYQRSRHDRITIHRLLLYPSHDRSPLRRTLNFASFALSLAIASVVIFPRTDVVYVYHPPGTAAFVASLLGRVFRKPVTVHVQDMWPESVTRSGLIGGLPLRVADRTLAAIMGSVYRCASTLVVISPGFRRLLIERGVPEEKIEVLYNWADEDRFAPGAADPQRKRDLELDGKFSVMFAGNLGFFQNLETAVLAAAEMRSYEDFRLVFVGSGQAEGELRRLAHDAGADNVVFIPRVPLSEALDTTRCADIHLISLEDQPFLAATIPGKTQAVMASGMPIIVAARGDVANLVEQADAGFAVEPGDVGALVTAFQSAYEGRGSHLVELGRNGRRYYETHHARRPALERLSAIVCRKDR